MEEEILRVTLPDREEGPMAEEVREPDGPGTVPAQEPHFAASFLPTKQIFMDFARLHARKSRMAVCYLVIGLIFCLGYMGLTLFLGPSWLYLLAGGAVWILAWLFMGEFLGLRNWRANKKAGRDIPVSFVFGREGMTGRNALAESRIRYSALTDVREGDWIFALYVGRNQAQLLPKGAFTEGTADEFRAFLSEKIEKPIRRYRTKSRIALKILLFVLSFALLAGLSFLPVAPLRTSMVTCYAPNYSIRLPSDFEVGSDPEYDFFASSYDSGVYAYRITRQELRNYMGRDMTLQEYAALLAYYAGVKEGETHMATDGSCRMTYTMVIEGTDYFFYDVISQGEDAYWETTFVCYREDQSAYEGRFAQWADSISCS